MTPYAETRYTETPYTEYPVMNIDSGYMLIGYNHIGIGAIELLLQKGGDFKKCVINEQDLQEMINRGILLEIDQDYGCFHKAFVKIMGGSV